MQEPLVSVICITYNHAEYIRNTLDGFLMQETSFPFEIVIHDDASTDGTDEIIREYAAKRPDIFIPIFQTENQYSKNKTIVPNILQKCRGKYYASCEGDDFWTDPHKLQIQVEYMENHPECMMTVHNALTFHHPTKSFYMYSGAVESHTLSPAEIIKSGFATASMVYRKEALVPQGSFYQKGEMGDWPLRLHVLEQGGGIYCFDRVMSLYRAFTPNSYCQRTYGAFVPALKHVYELIDLMESYNGATNGRFRKYLVTRIQFSCWDLFRISGAKSVDELNEKISECDESFLQTHRDYIQKLTNIFVQLFDEDAPLDSKIGEKIKATNHTVIYGAGHYGKKVAKQIKEAGLSFDGFVVTPGKNCDDNVEGKPVWQMDKLPFSHNDTFVVVSINPKIWDELADCMESCGIVRFGCPFLYDI